MKLRTLLAVGSLSSSSHAARLRTIHSQSSWIIPTQQMEIAVSEAGAVKAPGTCCRDSDRPVRPYRISPGHDEGLNLDVPVQMAQRGVWFCMPFVGDADACHVGRNPPHNDLATIPRSHVETKTEGGITALNPTLETDASEGPVTRELAIIDGHKVAFGTSVIECFADAREVSAQPNLRTTQGIKTAVKLTTEHPVAIGDIQGRGKVPPGFQQVKTLEFTPDRVTSVSVDGLRFGAAVRHEILMTGRL